MSDRDLYKPSCASKAAYGFYRGGLLGIAWGVFFPLPLQLPAERNIVDVSRFRRQLSLATSRLRSVGVSSAVFAVFLCTFDGMICATERLTKSKPGHWTSVFVGGCTAGLVLSFGSKQRSPRHILYTSLLTGCATCLTLQGYQTFFPNPRDTY